MRDELISLETAMLSKEKGFDWECFEYYEDQYDDDWRLSPIPFFSNHNDGTGIVLSAPTQSLLQRWLREQHNIYISVDPETIGSDEWEWSYKIQHLPKEHWEAKRRCGHFVYKSSYNESPGGTYWGAWETYEEALEVGLKEGLSLISGDNSKQ